MENHASSLSLPFVYVFVSVLPIFGKCRIIFSDMFSLLLNGCFWF